MPSKDVKQIIDHIVSRFLESSLNYKAEDFESIAQILDLPLYALKNISKDDARIFEDVFHIHTIRELGKLDPEHPFNFILPPQTNADIEKHIARCEQILAEAKAKVPDFEKLRTSILIANMITHSWEKRADYLNKKDTKVITIGLDNAGKTAILSMLGGKLGIQDLTNLQPTKRVERRKISTSSLDLYIWDFGGQGDYRKAYLENPEKFFLRTDLMIYVVDMQDANRYQISFDYLSEILSIMQRLNESPYILCFLHKADPDLLNDPDFQVSLEFVKEKIKFTMKDRPFEYDMYVTSIYNFFTSEPKFSKFIKDVMKDHQSLNDPMLQKVEGIGEILNTTLNAVVNLASSMGQQMSNLEFRLEQMERLLSQAQADGAILLRPKAPSEKQRNTPELIQQSSSISQELRQIQNKAVESSRNLQEIRAIPTPFGPTNNGLGKTAVSPDQEKKEATRLSVLKDLQGLFQKAKTIKR